MLSRLVPNGAVVVEAYEQQWRSQLLPAEQSLIAHAVDKRRQEFAAGRNCARQALAELGWPDFAVLWGRQREPVWPDGVLGSITHCPGYSAAVVARRADLGPIRGLGIDAEANAPLSDRVVERITTARERQALGDGLAAGLPALIFSAKEAVYKAWYPVAGRWLGFQDAEIDFDLASQRFSVALLPSANADGLAEPLSFAGRFSVTAKHVFTVVTARAE